MRAAVFLFAAAQLLGHSDAVALLRGGPSINTLSRSGARCVMQAGDESPEPVAAESAAGVDPADAAVAEAMSTGSVDLSTLDFDQRLAVLASRIPTDAAPVEEDDGVFPEGKRPQSPVLQRSVFTLVLHRRSQARRRRAFGTRPSGRCARRI